MLKDYIGLSKGFQSSVNIEYDFNDISKINGFIPTTSALEIIVNIISNTENEKLERAKILTGAYGRGKSHIILVALSILYNKDKKLFSQLLEKVKRIDENAYKIINNYITSSKRLLPIIINGSSNNLTQSFLNALQQAIHLYDLDDIMPETHFRAAINTIERWKQDYPDTYKAFENAVGEKADKFIKELLSNSVEAYNKFNSCYPSLTSGGIFNPFIGFDVVDIFDKTNNALKEKGFSGMYIVYDEFGKYLESSIATADESDTRFLQNMAEKCDRENSQQMHLILICHKDISNYIDMNLPKENVNGWRGISGRFEHIDLTNEFDQMYEIIANAIIKKDGWNDYYTDNKNVFDELKENVCVQLGLKDGQESHVADECYPLHPATTFALPRLSERVAQNERTLFTFLSANQKNTLREIIKKSTSDSFTIITPNYIYDYFEKELRKELSTSEIHKTYTLSAKVLESVASDDLSCRIIKTLAIMYFVQDFKCLPPTVDMLCSIFDTEFEKTEITNKIEQLIREQYVVYINSSNGYLRLKETSGIDVAQEIENKINKIKNEYTNEYALNLCANSNYLYPIRHNNEKCITRYFDLKFISFENFNKIKDFIISEGASGTVYAVFFEDLESFGNVDYQHVKDCNEFRAIFIFPKSFKNVTASVYTYLAAKSLMGECSPEEDVLKSEYALYIDDHESVVNDFISDYLRPELGNSIYYHDRKIKSITRKAQLTELLSDICDKAFWHTPIINNETLNKDNLTGVAITSRTKLVNAILENEVVDDTLGLTGTGQDVSFMRSSLIRTGVLTNKDEHFFITLEPQEESIAYVLNVISDFFRSTAIEGEKSFVVLYDTLRDPHDGIGMKLGPIPIFIAVVLSKLKKDLIFKCNGNEIKINSDALNSINEKPDNYSVVMENWDEGKSDYLNSLAEIFADHVSEKDKSFNSFTYIANAMNRWYLSLPKCAREMTTNYSSGNKISKERIEFVNSLKIQTTNSRRYLFETLPRIFKQTEITITLSDSIEKSKNKFDNAKNNLIEYVVNTLSAEFKCSENQSLCSGLSDWYGALKPQTIQHLFANNENAILALISSVGNDEIMFAERIGKALVGLRLDDWNNNVAKTFAESLKTFIKTVEDYDKENHDHQKPGSESYSITFKGKDGTEKVRCFEKVKYSKWANLLYQDITGAIEDIGQSVTEQEKRQVLMDILSKLCD